MLPFRSNIVENPTLAQNGSVTLRTNGFETGEGGISARHFAHGRRRTASFSIEFRLYLVLTLSLVLYFISASIGSGWLLLLSSGLLAISVLSFLVPCWSLASTSVFVSGPAKAIDGEDFDLTVTITPHTRLPLRWLVVRHMSAKKDGTAITPVIIEHCGQPETLSMRCCGLSRGLQHLPDIQLETAFPFGFVFCQFRLPTNNQVLVLPQAVPMEGRFLNRLKSSSYVPGSTYAGRFGLQSGSTRGIRPYVRGDSRRAIHWGSSARHGKLMVKELDLEGMATFDVAFDQRAHWVNEHQYELAVCAAASLLKMGHTQGIHPGLLILEYDSGPALITGIELQLDSLARLQRRPNARQQADLPLLEGRSRPVVLIVPAVDSQGYPIQVVPLVVRHTPTETTGAIPGSDGFRIVVSSKADLSVL